MATLWHTSESSEAVTSRSSLCRIVGKPPFRAEETDKVPIVVVLTLRYNYYGAFIRVCKCG